jgi:hypothetical protein
MTYTLFQVLIISIKQPENLHFMGFFLVLLSNSQLILSVQLSGTERALYKFVLSESVEDYFVTSASNWLIAKYHLVWSKVLSYGFSF